MDYDFLWHKYSLTLNEYILQKVEIKSAELINQNIHKSRILCLMVELDNM